MENIRESLKINEWIQVIFYILHFSEGSENFLAGMKIGAIFYLGRFSMELFCIQNLPTKSII